MASTAVGGNRDSVTLKGKRKSKIFIWVKRIILLGFALLLTVAGLITYANMLPVLAARGRLFDEIDNLPAAKVGLVFGTTDNFKGRENRYFRYRIDAAVKVWNAGKVETLIVSGDNREKNYNEPEKMKAALVARGLPKDRIICDYAGLRTFDSVVRAKKIFGADTILFISQRFQNERAIYLAKALSMEAYGFNAEDVEFRAGFKTKIREVGARVKMWLDVNFLDTKPTHLGDKIELPE